MPQLRARPSVQFDFPLTQADFQKIARIVYERSGIVLGEQKRDMVYARLAKRLRELRLTSFNSYCALLESRKEASEIGYLINAITTNLTKFFREPHHFEHLRQQVFPEIARFGGGERRQIRVWSAGCSSGEEPYSIAMTAIDARRNCREFEILATDLDTSMLQKASAGLFPPASLDGIPARFRDRFFETPRESAAGLVSVTKAVQDLVTFKALNLLEAWPEIGRFNVIFCRNVMIYFDAKTKARLIERFHSLLKDGGWLYVGHSESLLDHQARFTLAGRTVYRKTTP